MTQRSATRRDAIALAASATMTGMLAACSGTSSSSGSSSASSSAETSTDNVDVRVASLKGPTTIGLVQMMDTTSGIPTGDEAADDSSSSSSSGITYSYTISGSADEVLPLVISGDADIALVPSNAAAILYSKTKAGVEVIDVNTLGVLSVVTGDASIEQFTDLAGHTVYISGKGASPEYTLNFLLDKAGIAGEVTLEWKSEHTEVAAVLADDPTAIGVLPQPFTTATIAQNSALSAPISLTDVWNQYVTDGSEFVMGVTIARTEFASAHPTAVSDFLDRHAASVESVNADPATAAALVVKAGIVAKEAIAEKAIPACNVVCIEGDDMKTALSGYLQVLYDADPSSVGGSLPGEDFYYLG